MKSIAILASLVGAQANNNWAVLVSGTNGYTNYKDQASVCNAYRLMRKAGIPADQIIHMSYNDATKSAHNPIKGKLFDRPRGEDIYLSCPIDFEKVSADSFHKILRGEGSKSLKSSE